ncbi:MAG: OmpA family protein [Planctomycetes bacterium]|nr:OmpA family protein [Planctomycetota bacterium]
MKKASVIAVIGICAFIMLAGGCISVQEHESVLASNKRMADDLRKVRGELRSSNILLNQCQARLATATSLSGPEMQALKDKIDLLNQDIASKTALIKRMQVELSRNVIQLPVELRIALREFAQANDMVTFDEATGVLKFKSDLLFNSGSAKVLDEAKSGIASLAGIMNSELASQFDLVIAGHTDNDPIKYSKHLHATNWHLSSHRAIGVLELLTQNGISPKRLSARGFGEQRPLQPNETKEGKAANRRVEIYVIAPGM